MKITINGYDWQVIFVPEDDKRLGEAKEGYINLGYTCFDKLCIAISRDAEKQVQKNTIAHELIHAFTLSTGVYEMVWSEEEMCRFIGSNFLTLYDLYKQICDEKWDKEDAE